MANFGDRPVYLDRRARATDAEVCMTGSAHDWKPLSFALETTTRTVDDVTPREPEAIDARVYAVCLGCRSWTFLNVDYVGYSLGGPAEFDPTLDAFGRYKPWVEDPYRLFR